MVILSVSIDQLNWEESVYGKIREKCHSFFTNIGELVHIYRLIHGESQFAFECNIVRISLLNIELASPKSKKAKT